MRSCFANEQGKNLLKQAQISLILEQGKDISIGDLAHLIKKIVGYDGDLIFDTTKPDGTPRKLLDISKAKELGWANQISLEDGILSTYEWYKKNINKVRA